MKISNRHLTNLIREEIATALKYKYVHENDESTKASKDVSRDMIDGEEDLPTSLGDIYGKYREPWSSVDEGSFGPGPDESEDKLDEADPDPGPFGVTE